MRLLLVFSTKVQMEENRRYFTDDFPEVKKIVEGGVITKPQNDYDLSRYVCYLIVQNGDPRKDVVTLEQTCFAIHTYRQEAVVYFNELDEDNRRQSWSYS